MVNKTFNKKRRRGLIILIAFAVAIVAFMLVAFVLQNRSSPSNNQQQGIPVEGSIQMKGVALCLPHKDTSGPQTLECAIGLKDEKGNYYGLKDSDPGYKNISSLPMNQQVQVNGSFKKEMSSMYPTIGTIEVTKITRD
jgi:hypothetical protein